VLEFLSAEQTEFEEAAAARATSYGRGVLAREVQKDKQRRADFRSYQLRGYRGKEPKARGVQRDIAVRKYAQQKRVRLGIELHDKKRRNALQRIGFETHVRAPGTERFVAKVKGGDVPPKNTASLAAIVAQWKRTGKFANYSVNQIKAMDATGVKKSSLKKMLQLLLIRCGDVETNPGYRGRKLRDQHRKLRDLGSSSEPFTPPPSPYQSGSSYDCDVSAYVGCPEPCIYEGLLIQGEWLRGGHCHFCPQCRCHLDVRIGSKFRHPYLNDGVPSISTCPIGAFATPYSEDDADSSVDVVPLEMPQCSALAALPDPCVVPDMCGPIPPPRMGPDLPPSPPLLPAGPLTRPPVTIPTKVKRVLQICDAGGQNLHSVHNIHGAGRFEPRHMWLMWPLFYATVVTVSDKVVYPPEEDVRAGFHAPCKLGRGIRDKKAINKSYHDVCADYAVPFPFHYPKWVNWALYSTYLLTLALNVLPLGLAFHLSSFFCLFALTMFTLWYTFSVYTECVRYCPELLNEMLLLHVQSSPEVYIDRAANDCARIGTYNIPPADMVEYARGCARIGLLFLFCPTESTQRLNGLRQLCLRLRCFAHRLPIAAVTTFVQGIGFSCRAVVLTMPHIRCLLPLTPMLSCVHAFQAFGTRAVLSWLGQCQLFVSVVLLLFMGIVLTPILAWLALMRGLVGRCLISTRNLFVGWGRRPRSGWKLTFVLLIVFLILTSGLTLLRTQRSGRPSSGTFLST